MLWLVPKKGEPFLLKRFYLVWKIENFITNAEEIYKVTEFWDKRTNEAIIPSISDMVKAKSDHRNRPSSFTIQLAFMSFFGL